MKSDPLLLSALTLLPSLSGADKFSFAFALLPFLPIVSCDDESEYVPVDFPEVHSCFDCECATSLNPIVASDPNIIASHTFDYRTLPTPCGQLVRLDHGLIDRCTAERQWYSGLYFRSTVEASGQRL